MSDSCIAYCGGTSGTSLFEVLTAVGTIGAVVAALVAALVSWRSQRRALRAEGRRQVAFEIAEWAHRIETMLGRWHDPDTVHYVRLPPDGAEGSPGRRSWRNRLREMRRERPEAEPPAPDEPDVYAMPLSHGRVAPAIEAAVQDFDRIRSQARLAFGKTHTVSRLIESLIEAVEPAGLVGPISDGTFDPREQLDRTIRPLVDSLFEALAEACDLRA